MNLTDEIARLHRLRQDGALTAAEFEQAKAALLAGAAGPSLSPDGSQQYFAGASGLFHDELNRADREWTMEREKYMIRSRRGGSSEPNSLGVIASSVFTIAFALFWTFMAAGMRGQNLSMAGLRALIESGLRGQNFFPLFGIALIIFSVVSGAWQLIQAQRYRRAKRRYQQRRDAILARHGQSDYARSQSDFSLYR